MTGDHIMSAVLAGDFSTVKINYFVCWSFLSVFSLSRLPHPPTPARHVKSGPLPFWVIFGFPLSGAPDYVGFTHRFMHLRSDFPACVSFCWFSQHSHRGADIFHFFFLFSFIFSPNYCLFSKCCHCCFVSVQRIDSRHSPCDVNAGAVPQGMSCDGYFCHPPWGVCMWSHAHTKFSLSCLPKKS